MSPLERCTETPMHCWITWKLVTIFPLSETINPEAEPSLVAGPRQSMATMAGTLRLKTSAAVNGLNFFLLSAPQAEPTSSKTIKAPTNRSRYRISLKFIMQTSVRKLQKLEIHFYVGHDGHRLAVLLSRLEDPLRNSLDRLLVQAQAERLGHPNVGRIAILIYNEGKNYSSLKLRGPRFFRVLRFSLPEYRRGRYPVARSVDADGGLVGR